MRLCEASAARRLFSEVGSKRGHTHRCVSACVAKESILCWFYIELTIKDCSESRLPGLRIAGNTDTGGMHRIGNRLARATIAAK